jgi:hypothetical protein
MPPVRPTFSIVSVASDQWPIAQWSMFSKACSTKHIRQTIRAS